MLVIYALESKAVKLDRKLLHMKNLLFKYLLFQKAILEKRIAALYGNEIINVDARYKILYNVEINN